MSDQPDMEPFLKTFSIGFLLRSAFAGVFFPVAYYVALNGETNLSKINIGDELSSAITLALVGGVFAYGIHRSVIYPVTEWVLNSRLANRLRRRVPLISKRTIYYLTQRWERPSEPLEEEKDYARHLTTWADYTHLLYASTISIIMGAAVGDNIGSGSHPPCWPLWSLGFCFWFAGFISDWRLHSVEDSLCEMAGDELGVKRIGCFIGSAAFMFMSIMNICRLWLRCPIYINGVDISMWVSVVLTIVFFILAFVVWR